MSTGNVVYMVLILGLVFGGFLACLLVLWREQETDDGAGE